MKFRDDVSATYSSFSLYSGAIGYGIILGSIAIFFFLFSHQKKERIRAYIPFRLSDAQAIVFVDSMILTGCIEIILVSLQYSQFAINGVSLGIGFVMAISSTLLILVSAFFFSQNEKESGIAMSYLDKKDRDVLSEYQDILDGGYPGKKSPEKEKNMTLPF